MSLESLSALRSKRRLAPDAVWVLVGDVPAWLDDASPDTVKIRPGCRDFDFRPLIGLHVDVFELGDHLDLLERTLKALEAAKPKSQGLACLAGVAGLNEAHERVLRESKRMMT